MSLKERYPDGVLELGDGMRLQFRERHDGADYSWATVHHIRDDVPLPAAECEGSIWFRGDGKGHAEWDVVSESPLTLSPSLLCHCGFHGWVREGKWVDA